MKSTPAEESLLKEIKHFDTTECHRMEISDQNHLALLNKLGIELVSLNCSALSKRVFSRELISPSTAYPLEKFLENPHNTFLWNLNLSSLRKISLLPESIGLFQRTQASPIFVDYKFSITFKNTCYLACVTSTGVLNIYLKAFDEWKMCCDISDIWLSKCSKLWKYPETESEWINILEEGQIVRVCWATISDLLYIIATLKNGDIIIFSTLSDEIFNAKYVTRIKGKSSYPTFISAFSTDTTLIIVQGFYCGIVNCLFVNLNSMEVVKDELLSSDEDFLQIFQVLYITSEESVEIFINKRHFLVNYNVSLSSNKMSSRQINLESSLSNIHISNEILYVCLFDMTVVEFASSTLCEIKRYSAGPNIILQIATSCNSFFRVIAIPQSHNNVQISFIPCSSQDYRALLRSHCETGGRLNYFLDLIWIYKVTLLNNIKSLTEDDNDDLKWPKLRYWELMLFLNDTEIDQDTQSKIAHRLNQLELYLITKTNSTYFKKFSETFDEHPEKCPVCGELATFRNIAMLRCKRGHSIQRCCITMEPCLPINYVSCVYCPAKINLPLPDGVKLETMTCSFCDGYFEENGLLLK